jgi:hypothetical protein
MTSRKRTIQMARAAILGTLLMQGCGDAPTQAKLRPEKPSLACGSTTGPASSATFTYAQDQNMSVAASGSMYVGELRYVKIVVRDGNSCVIGPNNVSVTVTSPSQVGIQVFDGVQLIYRLQGLKSEAGVSQLKVTSSGGSVTSNLSVSRPTIRLYDGAGSLIVSPFALQVGSYTPVTAKAFAGSSGPLIPTVGWPAGATWTTANSAIATVRNDGTNAGSATANAAVKGEAVGSTSVTVQLLGESVTLPVNSASPAPVASVSVSGPASLTQGQTGQYQATARDAGSNVLTGRPVSWSSSNTSVATVNSGGTVTAVAPGTASIIATVQGVQGSTSLQVNAPAPVASVTVTGPTSLTQGQSGNFQAITRDAGSNVLTGRAISWSSSNTSVATVNSAGVVTTVSAGTVSIIATSEGVQGSASLQVNAPPQQPGVNLTVTYPGNVPTLNWTTTFAGDHEVYVLREEQFQSPFGDSYNESLEYLGTTSGTSFQHSAESYTQETAWVCTEPDGDGGTLTVRKFYVVVPVSTPTVNSNRAMSKTIDIGGSCWS